MLRALSNDLQTILSKLTLPLGCVRRIDKRAKKVPHFTYTSKRWELRMEAPMTEEHVEMSYSYIAPARRADGQEVILKINSPVQRLENEQNECHALQLCDGNSAVQLLDYDEESGTLMLARAEVLDSLL